MPKSKVPAPTQGNASPRRATTEANLQFARTDPRPLQPLDATLNLGTTQNLSATQNNEQGGGQSLWPRFEDPLSRMSRPGYEHRWERYLVDTMHRYGEFLLRQTADFQKNMHTALRDEMHSFMGSNDLREICKDLTDQLTKTHSELTRMDIAIKGIDGTVSDRIDNLTRRVIDKVDTLELAWIREAREDREVQSQLGSQMKHIKDVVQERMDNFEPRLQQLVSDCTKSLNTGMAVQEKKLELGEAFERMKRMVEQSEDDFKKVNNVVTSAKLLDDSVKQCTDSVRLVTEDLVSANVGTKLQNHVNVIFSEFKNKGNEAIADFANQLKNASEEACRVTSTLHDHAASSLLESKQKGGEAITAFARDVKSIQEDVQTRLNKLVEDSSKAADRFDNAIERSSKSVEECRERFGTVVGKCRDKMIEYEADVGDKLRKASDDIRNFSDATKNKLQDSTNETLADLKNAAKEFSIIENSFKGLVGSIESSMAKIAQFKNQFAGVMLTTIIGSIGSLGTLGSVLSTG